MTLFVRTGSEEKLVRVLKDKWEADEYLPFLPVRGNTLRKRGYYPKGTFVLPNDRSLQV